MNRTKVYVAGRAKHRREDVAAIQKKLRSLGYEIAYDWPAGDGIIKKPYRENREANLKAQSDMLKAAARTDIFILLDDEGLRGAYIELGAFLTDCLDNPNGRRAYIVGPASHQRQFVFESPDYVHIVDTVDQVYDDLSRLDYS